MGGNDIPIFFEFSLIWFFFLLLFVVFWEYKEIIFESQRMEGRVTKEGEKEGGRGAERNK